MIDAGAVWAGLSLLRERKPLVLNVTNNVVTNFTANVLLALGASPAMTHQPEDAAGLAALSGAVVLNMGTPGRDNVDSMLAAGKAANDQGRPVVFDPVAAGATAWRREVASLILSQVRMDVVRGNASEILHLAGRSWSGRGVDSRSQSHEALDAARALACGLSCVVCASGARDLITDGERVYLVDNGHPMMPLVTGLGCASTAVVAAFLAQGGEALEAAVLGMAVTGLAGELAAQGCPGPGSLQVRFLDALYGLDAAALALGLKVAQA